MARPKTLIYLGKEGPRKGDWFTDVPARDLDANDIAALTDEQLANILGSPDNGLGPLYVEPEPAVDAPKKGKDGP